ncbi:MAG: putative addiction module antidote protein [Bdellovibrio sp.]|nr:putative addiction module antidote protein [Bdellovibrio sp.]
MPKRTRDYELDLIEKLKDIEFSVEYLNASLEDSDEGSDERFLMALRQVAQAHGMTAIAERSGMARPALYRALSESGNPEFLTLKALLDSLGLKLAVESRDDKKEAS